MEAWRFGFDPSLPPAFKFDPTDADLVAHYLLPRALNLPNPHAHAVIDADPSSCPPWELMRRHGHAGSDHAFFFGPPREVTKNGIARSSRSVPAGEDGVRGKWRGQKGQDERLSLLPRCGDGEVVVTYKKYNLTYYNEVEEDDGKTTGLASGWVMQEYQIVDPPLHPGVVLARVKVADRASKEHRKKRKKMSSAPPYQGQPGPSSNYDYHHVDGHAAGTSSSAQVFVVQENDQNDGEGMEGEPVGNYTDELLLHFGEGIGCFLDENNNYVIEDMNAYFNNFNQGYEYMTAPETAAVEVSATMVDTTTRQQH